MTREEFIEALEEKGYPYEIEGDKIVVTDDRYVDFLSLKTLPSGVEFKNRGDVNLGSLETLPPGVEFRNGEYVFLNSLETIPPGVVFENGRSVFLDSITGGYFDRWNGNIEGIDSKRLLNKMISIGLFDR